MCDKGVLVYIEFFCDGFVYAVSRLLETFLFLGSSNRKRDEFG
jgi:hypothetical protein